MKRFFVINLYCDILKTIISIKFFEFDLYPYVRCLERNMIFQIYFIAQLYLFYLAFKFFTESSFISAGICGRHMILLRLLYRDFTLKFIDMCNLNSKLIIFEEVIIILLYELLYFKFIYQDRYIFQIRLPGYIS